MLNTVIVFFKTLPSFKTMAVGTLPDLSGGTLGEGWRPPNVPPWSGR